MAYVDRASQGNKIASEKAQETKRRIKDAFITLYADAPIERIGIKRITDLAGLNRGTFYVYYADVYDLLDDIEQEWFAHIKTLAPRIVGRLFDGESPAEELDLSLYHEYLPYVKVLLASYGKSKLTEMIKEEAKGVVRAKLMENREIKDPVFESMLEYHMAGLLGVIGQWMREERRIALDELVRNLADVALQGVIPALKERAEQKR